MVRTSMRALMLGLALAAGAPAGVAAQSPAQAPNAAARNAHAEALVRRYFAAVHFERTMDSLQAAMLPVISEQAAREHPEITPEDRQMIIDITRKLLREKMMPELMDRIVPVYAATFTEGELEALVTFYESPTGRSITEKVPTLAPKSAEITRELMPGMLAEMVKEVLARKCPNGNCSPPRTPAARTS